MMAGKTRKYILISGVPLFELLLNGVFKEGRDKWVDPGGTITTGTKKSHRDGAKD